MENFFDFSPLKIVSRGHFSLGKHFPGFCTSNEKPEFTSGKRGGSDHLF